MLDELAIEMAQEKSRHKEELSDVRLQHEKEVLSVRARYEKELRGLHEDKNRTEEEIRSQLREEKVRRKERGGGRAVRGGSRMERRSYGPARRQEPHRVEWREKRVGWREGVIHPPQAPEPHRGGRKRRKRWRQTDGRVWWKLKDKKRDRDIPTGGYKS